MIIRFKHFYGSLNIAVILAPGCEFFTAKCNQFLGTFMKGNQIKDIFPSEISSFIFEIKNFKGHLNSVLLCK